MPRPIRSRRSRERIATTACLQIAQILPHSYLTEALTKNLQEIKSVQIERENGARRDSERRFLIGSMLPLELAERYKIAAASNDMTITEYVRMALSLFYEGGGAPKW